MHSRFSFLAALALLAVCPAVARCQDNAAPRPIGVQELSLLLRSGYTGDEVLRETAGRPLLAPIDDAAERALRDAGADARTVAALRDGRRVVTANEAADAQQRQAVADQHRLESWEADQARRLDANRQAVQARLAARREDELKQIATSLREKLVIYADGRLVPYSDVALAGKKVFLFYSVATGRASHQLNQQLAEFYKKYAPAHPEFEVVLLSTDQSAANMEEAMRQEAMPWPALAWDQLAQQPSLAALGKEGTPRLVLVDGSGRKLADNLENGKIVVPQHVIDVLTGKASVKPTAPTAAR